MFPPKTFSPAKRPALRPVLTVFLSLAFVLELATVPSRAEEKKAPSSVTSSKPMKLSGYGQLRYSSLEDATDTFSVRVMRLGLEGEVWKGMRLKVMGDLTRSPVLLDARADIGLLRRGTLTVGQFKIPFSQENLTSTSALDMVDRARTVKKLCPGQDIGTGGRDIGATFSLGYGPAEASLGVFNGAGINKTDTNEEKDLAVRIVLKPLDFLSLGASSYQGHFSSAVGSPASKRDRTGLELALVRNAWSLKAEYIHARDGNTKGEGFYLQVGYFLLADKVQTLLRFDAFDKNRNQSLDRNDIATVGLNWFFTAKTKLQVNAEVTRDEGKSFGFSAFLVQLQAGF